MRPLEVYERPHCFCCGQMVTWRPIDTERGGRAVAFCDAKCVEVFDSYYYPTYGDVLFSGSPNDPIHPLSRAAS